MNITKYLLIENNPFFEDNSHSILLMDDGIDEIYWNDVDNDYNNM